MDELDLAPGFAERQLLKLLSFKIYYFGFARVSFKAYRVPIATKFV